MAIGVYSLQAVAVDDSLARSTSAPVTVTVTAAAARVLDFSPRNPSDTFFEFWNATRVNWRFAGQPALFHAGDTVNIAFSRPLPIYVGDRGGIAQPVSPASAILRNVITLEGGDILTGGVTVDTAARVTFSNYAGSLSFPGGTLIEPGANLTFDVSSVQPLHSVHFGAGAITNTGTFILQTADAGATLENDFIIPDTLSSIMINPTVRPSAVARFTGALQLGGELSVLPSTSLPQPQVAHEWSGPFILRPRPNGVVRFKVLAGNYRPLLISGSIMDAPGATNVLGLSGLGPVRVGGMNTYAHGTRIEGGNVEVLAESSLGTGDVEVSSGTLTLFGNANIAAGAAVTMRGGIVAFGNGVKIRLKSLRLGNTFYTNGIFSGTNIFYATYLRSNGSFRLPPQNVSPTVELASPPNGIIGVRGATINIRANAADVDGYIARVEFRINGAPFAARTNAPYEVSLRNAPAGVYELQAVCYDDDGGIGYSSIVNAYVQPRIDRVEYYRSNQVVLEFEAPWSHPIAVQATDVLPALDWTDLGSFRVEPLRSRIRFTNAVPDQVPMRFYRLALPP